jgi:hypothetical protein
MPSSLCQGLLLWKHFPPSALSWPFYQPLPLVLVPFLRTPIAFKPKAPILPSQASKLPLSPLVVSIPATPAPQLLSAPHVPRAIVPFLLSIQFAPLVSI